jgi:TolB-like protein
MSFWGELKRRNIFKVGAAYAIVAWLLAQIASLAFPAFHMPQWTVTFVMSLLVIGFPLILLFAWAFEITPDGIKRTRQVPLEESITHVTGRKLNYMLAGLLIVAVGYIVIDKVFVARRSVETETASNEKEQTSAVTNFEEAAKTIAVLPFENLSSDPEQEYFVDGLSEELLNCLAKIKALSVTSRTSAFSFKETTNTVQEIADVLGVDHILEGSVRKAGNTIRITTQLIRVADDRHLWSDQYDRELKNIEDILSIQDDIAKAVSNELKVTLGIGESFKQLGGTDNLEAYELYLKAVGGRNDRDVNLAFKSIDAAIALDPEFAKAWALKASIHSGSLQLLPTDRIAAEKDAALQAAMKSIELEPNLVAGHYALSYARLSRGEFIEAEYEYRKAVELTIEKSSGNYAEGLPVLYLAVGNFKRAHEILETVRQNDPLNQIFRSLYFLSLNFLGDVQQAELEFERCRSLFGDPWFGEMFMRVIHLGIGEAVTRNQIICIDAPVCETAKAYLDSPEEGITELHRLYVNENELSIGGLYEISIWAAYFGDLGLAMDALSKAVWLDPSLTSNIWYPVMHEVRQLPRFKKFVREIGLVDYWDRFGWPDLCRPLGTGDFECD